MTKVVVSVAVGVILLVTAGILAARTRAFIRTARAAPGVVEGLNAGGSHPQIGFTTPAGVRVSYPQGGLISGYRPGQPVRALYDPADPEGTARIDAFGALWFDVLILSIFGLIFSSIGLSGALKVGGRFGASKNRV